MFGIRASILTGILLVAIGIMNNAIVTSGIGNSFSLMIAQWSQGSMVIAILLIGLASLVLGMGLPVTAAYIILAILSAPALAGILADGVIVDQLIQGIADPSKSAMFMLVDSPHISKIGTGMSRPEALELMSAMPFEVAITLRPLLVDAEQLTTYLLIAHLIVFWLSQDSNVTPPVCLAAFTAAGIAKSPPMATDTARLAFFALFGIYAINCLVQNYAEGPLKIWHYPLLVLGVFGTFFPLNLIFNFLGAVLIILCGQAAASSSFIQAYSVIRVTNAESRIQIAEAAGGQRWVEEAPEFLVFCADLKRIEVACIAQGAGALEGNTEHFLAASVDVALMAQNILLAAESMELGGVFIGGIRNDPQLVSNLLDLPDQVYPVFGMCIGWPAIDPDVKPRFPVKTILHQESYAEHKVEAQVESYDSQMKAYYQSRSGKTRASNWSEQTAKAVQDKKREHLLGFLQKLNGAGFNKLVSVGSLKKILFLVTTVAVGNMSLLHAGDFSILNKTVDSKIPTVSKSNAETTSIGSVLFNDVNGNGIKESDEKGLPGVHVKIFDENGLEIKVGPDGIYGTEDDNLGDLVTDERGRYQFQNISQNFYRIRVVGKN
ncbi:NADPH-flavin oxidoreductase [Nymphon striatum]|nr:NADPH-flavin oxidoreductase [Nymphon striatum]